MSDLTTVDFHGAKLVAVKGSTPAETLVAMKPVVEGMGLNWERQREKLAAHPVLTPATTIRGVQMPGDDQNRDMVFLPLTKLNFWLATIHPNKIKDADVRAKVIEYQEECADVLFAHFFAKAAGDVMDARTVGMMKMVAHKVTGTEKMLALMANAMEERDREIAELTDIVKGLVKCADGRLAAVDAVPALQIATDAKVPKAGRRPIVQEISRKLTRFCADNGYVVRRDARGTKLYTVNAVNEWRLAGGDSLIRKLVAANTVIGPLFAVVPGGKGQPSA